MPESKTLNNLNWTEQLVVLRDLTRRFETLHEAQVLQLKLWPYTVDPTIQSNQAGVDFEAKKVIFNWTGSKMKSYDKRYRKRLQELANNIKFLLGEDWCIEVYSEVGSNKILIFPLAQDTKNVKRSRNRRNSQKRIKRAKCKGSRR